MNIQDLLALCWNEIGSIQLELKASHIEFPTMDPSLNTVSEYARQCAYLSLVSGIDFPDTVKAIYQMDAEQLKTYKQIRMQYFSHRIQPEERKILLVIRAAPNVVYYFKFLEVVCKVEALQAKKRKSKIASVPPFGSKVVRTPLAKSRSFS